MKRAPLQLHDPTAHGIDSNIMGSYSLAKSSGYHSHKETRALEFCLQVGRLVGPRATIETERISKE